ncbi:hypothetical protein BKA62DRAFT_766781 [Auriculariales sp. MPI-PUGE-AT-0066]|nr:hypothetical protein BKA62DRAFT_766781 [Auriculariales sp. MPI-PUGE-AT-0066]
MLLRHAAKRGAVLAHRPSLLLRPGVHLQQRRTFLTETFAAGANQIIDLSLAIPWPADWPPYASTIVLLTLLQRTALLPLAIWTKRKVKIGRDVVVPELKRNSVRVVNHIEATPLPNGLTKDTVMKVRRESYRELMEARRKQLFSHFGVGISRTVILPTLVQLGTFIPMSMLFVFIAVPPTPLDSECFMHLTNLTRNDPSNILPVAIGILNMANVDSHRWLVRTPLLKEQQQVDQNVIQAQIAKGGPLKRRNFELKLNPSGMMTALARSFSVLRIVFAMQMPGTVLIYWTVSAAYSLAQSFVLEYWSSRSKPIQLPVPPLNFRKLTTDSPATLRKLTSGEPTTAST